MSNYPKIWKPFTIQKGAKTSLKVVRGEGIWLELEDGQKVMDLISSWWVNLHGHGNVEIASAIAEQAQKLEHVIFADFTHEPAEIFVENLLAQTSGVFDHLFYSDNGSTAVEVSLKMAVQYWKNHGESHKTRFIAFDGAYHGDTFGAMSAGSRSVFSEVFNDMLFTVDFVSYPETWQNDDNIEQKETDAIAQIESLLHQNSHKYAGIIIEPLVQGAGGMRMCRPQFLQKLEEAAKKTGVLVIYDEVMTGFGRTGEIFAYKKAGTCPDIICLSKGITGGFMPMAVTLTSRTIFESFYSDEASKTLWHGHSYTGNPLGCAAANASLSLLLKSTDKIRQIEENHRGFVKSVNSAKIERIRQTGTIVAMDFVANGERGYLNSISKTLKERFLEKGMMVRPLGNVLYLMPPYCITSDELGNVYATISEIAETLG